MCPAGRPPKPTALRVLQGNPGHRPLPKGEPKPVATMPARPEWLLPEAKREWSRLAPQLVRLGVLTEIDRVPFAMLCQAWGRYQRSQRRLDEIERIGAAGSLEHRREVMIEARYFAEVAALAGRFGLTASDRARLRLPEEKPVDPFETFLSSGRDGTDG